jgi:hypothetical protein
LALVEYRRFLFFIFGIATHNHKRKKRKKELLRIIEKKLGSGFKNKKKRFPEEGKGCIYAYF